MTFLYPSFNRHLGCVYMLAVVNNAAIHKRNIHLFKNLDFNSFGPCAAATLLGPFTVLSLSHEDPPYRSLSCP